MRVIKKIQDYDDSISIEFNNDAYYHVKYCGREMYNQFDMCFVFKFRDGHKVELTVLRNSYLLIENMCYIVKRYGRTFNYEVMYNTTTNSIISTSLIPII